MTVNPCRGEGRRLLPDPIDFYFDFSSPYGYFGAEKIEALAADYDREVRWHPILLGIIFQESGTKPIVDYPLKGNYARHDVDRLARFMEVPFTMPDPFPVSSATACRAFYLLNDQDPNKAKTFALDIYRAFFRDGLNISEPSIVFEIAEGLSSDHQDLETAVREPDVKQRLRDEIAEAMKRGVFGSPFFLIDGEPFWGADRFWMMKRWLKTGGW